MANLLALDISTNTGWAMYLDGRTSSGVLNLPTEDYGDMGNAFGQWLGNRLAEGIDLLVIERPSFRVISDSSYRCDGLCFTAHTIARLHDVERMEYRPSEWRKAMFGKGNMKTKDAKAKAMEWARDQGFNPMTHDEAEALCILTFVLEGL